MISAQDRRQAFELIDETRANGAGMESACKERGISKRTYLCCKKKLKVDGNLDDLLVTTERPTPANKLTEEEEQTILNMANSSKFADSSPRQMVWHELTGACTSASNRASIVSCINTIWVTIENRKGANAPLGSNSLATDPNQV